MSQATELLTASEVARQLRVSDALVYRWASEGVIGSVRSGRVVRFRQAHVDAFVAKNERASDDSNGDEAA